MPSATTVAIAGQSFLLNGKPTFPGRSFRGHKVEGLLPNSRMVQGVFDDLNPDTRGRWDYPDGSWDPQRNTREFIAAMPTWRAHGLLAFTLNLQGGSPEGYSRQQPWHNSAFAPDGSLRPDFMARAAAILDAADRLGMAVILGLFYFGQDQRLEGDAAVTAAVDHTTDWLLQRGDHHVLVELANEINLKAYDQPLLTTAAAPDLLERIMQRSRGKLDTPAGRLLVSTSLSGNAVPGADLVDHCDFLLLHGNGVAQPDGIRALVDKSRAVATYRDQPVVINEDDHYDFDEPDNNFIAALDRHASWGFFDFRRKGEPVTDGYQSVPVDWSINSHRKRGFFTLLKEVTGI